ncbi:MAG: YbjN domain-containing protein, partial [Myxococcota bacterium]
MESDILKALHERIEEDLDGLARTPEGLQAVTDARWGEVTIHIEHDGEAGAVRVSATVPPPAGAGPEFLVWCLALNAQYFGVKLGLDEEGRLMVHGDLDADAVDGADLASEVVETAESIIDVIDDELVEWCLAHGLG